MNHFCTDSHYPSINPLQKIDQSPYDVIVSDYQMPNKDGIDLLKQPARELPFSFDQRGMAALPGAGTVYAALRANPHGGSWRFRMARSW